MVVKINAALLNPDECPLIVALHESGELFVEMSGAVTGADVARLLREVADRFEAEPVEDRGGVQRPGHEPEPPEFDVEL